MPKSILVDPRIVRKKSTLEIPPIPLNHYSGTAAAEKKKYGSENLGLMLRDMKMIREFETMLNTIKTTGSYHDMEYDHKGPAHLSIGQEALVVGQAFNLNVDDYVFGSHRSHGEIIAKCFSAIQKLDEKSLQSIMETFMDGRILQVVEKDHSGDIKDLAMDFILYATLAEIFGRENGVNKGMGGSMHAFFTPFGSMPNNAIVGGSADIAVGSALFKRVNRKPGIVIANIGDASSACGPTWEAMCFSAMDQYRELWDKDIGGAPPILFNFINNFYGMGGQTDGETMGFDILARIGAGINEFAMHAERIDGNNPLAVADAIERKRIVLEKGDGPVLLDTITYRFSGHSPSDQSSYRSKEEVELWEASDCIQAFTDYITTNKHMEEAKISDMGEWITAKVKKAYSLATDLDVSPRINVTVDTIGSMMFSNGTVERFDDRKPDVLLELEENPRTKGNARKSRSAFDENGKAIVKARVIAFRDALFEAMIHRFYEDPTMIAYGEENRDWGGAFAVYRGLTEALPYHRLFNSPIAEASIVGTAVGYALSGGRVVAELMYCDFMGRAGDEIFNQMAKWQSMSANVLKMPLVLRVSVGSKYGAQHSQDWSSLTAHIPGLKVYFPTTPYDAKGMLNLALRGTDPVVFFESQRLYDIGEQFAEGGVPVDYYEVEEGQPDIKRSGSDITIITIGATLYKALDAADELQEKYGLSAEVIDARFINPLNYDKIIESIKKTGRVVLASDACERGSFLHTMSSHISTMAFDHLDGPPVVVGARNWITPPAEMEDAFFPQKEWIIDAIHQFILPLNGHTVTTVQSTGEMQRRNSLGI
ncbi:MAG: dehydrogenase [Lentisphaeria bacterium]|nr:thiamine pyrophosphate-dependent enzyme [Lentisphaeria bacterium]NQZ68284.1 dehydrogenase [Lentisphaeria bacterium]